MMLAETAQKFATVRAVGDARGLDFWREIIVPPAGLRECPEPRRDVVEEANSVPGADIFDHLSGLERRVNLAGGRPARNVANCQLHPKQVGREDGDEDGSCQPASACEQCSEKDHQAEVGKRKEIADFSSFEVRSLSAEAMKESLRME